MEQNWKGHFSTGSRSSYPLLPVLSDHGKIDKAYEIMSSEQYPGLGHKLSFGTGTIGKIWAMPEAPPISSHCQTEGFTQMTTWFFKDLCGLRPDPAEPGFKHFYVNPKIPDKLKYAKMEYESNYGLIRITWEKSDKDLHINIDVPQIRVQQFFSLLSGILNIIGIKM